MRRFLRLKVLEVFFLTIGHLALALSIWRTIGGDIALVISIPVVFYSSKAIFGCFFPRLPDQVGPWVLIRSISTANALAFSVFSIAFVFNWLWLLPAASFVFGMTDAYYMPSVNALVPRVVRRRDVPDAYRISFFLSSFGRVFGLLIGFVGYQMLSNATSLGGLTVIIIAVLLVAVGAKSFPYQALRKALEDPRRGLSRFSKVQFEIEWSIISLVINAVTVTFSTLVIPLAVLKVFQSGPLLIGVFEASVTVGVVIGALFIHKFVASRLGDTVTVVASLAILGFTMVGYALFQTVYAWIAISFVVGAVIVMNNATVEARRALAVPEAERGYFQTAHHFIIQSGVPLGLLLSSIGVLDRSLESFLIISGAVIMCCAIWLALSGTFRHFMAVPKDNLSGYFGRFIKGSEK